MRKPSGRFSLSCLLVFSHFLLTTAECPGRELKTHPAPKDPSNNGLQTAPSDLSLPIVATDLDAVAVGVGVRYLLVGGGQWSLYETEREMAKGRVDGQAVACGFIGHDPDRFFVTYQNRRGQLETKFYDARNSRRVRVFERSSKRAYRSDESSLLSQAQADWRVLEGNIRIEMVSDQGKLRKLLEMTLPPETSLYQFARVDVEGHPWIVRQFPDGRLEAFHGGRNIQTRMLPPSEGPVHFLRPDNVGKMDRGVAPMVADITGDGRPELLVVINEPAPRTLPNLFADPIMRSRVMAFRLDTPGLEPLWESEVLEGYVPVLRRFDNRVIVPVVEKAANRTVIHMLIGRVDIRPTTPLH